MIPNKASHCVSCLACISLPSLMLAGKSIMLRHYETIYTEACICTRLLKNRSHDGTMLAFSSADGYCSTIVFDEEELGVIGKLPARESITMTPSIDNDISYEQQHATEKDVVMMDISSPPQPIRVEKRAAIATVTPQSDKTKKRRIAPTLISSSLPSSTISPCSSSRIFPNETQNQGWHNDSLWLSIAATQDKNTCFPLHIYCSLHSLSFSHGPKNNSSLAIYRKRNL